jgi:predicted phage-related endonuclease
MKMLCETEQAWKGEKTLRLGSTDARALLGCGYAGEDESTVYDRMVHGIKKSFTSDQLALMREGQLMEPAILQMFAAKNPDWDVHPTQGFVLTLNSEYPDLCCTLDATATKAGQSIVVEVKNEQNGKWEDYEDNNCKLAHYLQVQHQLIVTGYQQGVLVSLLRGRYLERWIDRDEELIEQMQYVYANFMEKVRKRQRPSGSPQLEYASAAASAERNTVRHLGKASSECVREAARLQEQIAQLERTLSAKRKQVVDVAQGCEWVVTDDQRIFKLAKGGLGEKPKLPPNAKWVN